MRIYKSNWIPRSTIFKILFTTILSLETIVSALIDKEHKWNKKFYSSTFMPKDTDEVIKSPLPKIPRLDQLIWSFDEHNNYLKSGYQSCT